ncbi:MAG: protoglobin domain-containing protein [Candidatus Thiodiazotropha sp.]
MDETDYLQLTRYAKAFTGLTPEKEALLLAAAPVIKPGLPGVTERFYSELQRIDRTAPFIEGRLEQLKATHLAWLEGLFSGPYDEAYTRAMYRVGQVHVKVHLPVEFMSGGMSLIGEELIDLVCRVHAGEPHRWTPLLKAVNAVIGFSLLVMQQSYQSSSLTAELDRFLAITGMSRTLFDNLAGAYRN